MIKNIITFLGIKREIENEYKKMLDFPKTLITIDLISLFFLILNKFSKFIKFNSKIDLFLFMLVGVIFIVSVGLKIKIDLDFKKIKDDFDKNFWDEYRRIYNTIKENGKIEDITINIDENKLSRNLDIKCNDQRITEDMLSSFDIAFLDAMMKKESKINTETINEILKTFFEDGVIDEKFSVTMDTWDFFQIQGLREANIVNNKAVLIMQDKLPSPDEQTENNVGIISWYLDAIKTLKEENKISYKEKEKEEVKRSIIEPEKEAMLDRNNAKIIEEINKKKKEQEEIEIKKMIENDENFKGKDISEIIDILNRINK